MAACKYASVWLECVFIVLPPILLHLCGYVSVRPNRIAGPSKPYAVQEKPPSAPQLAWDLSHISKGSKDLPEDSEEPVNKASRSRTVISRTSLATIASDDSDPMDRKKQTVTAGVMTGRRFKRFEASRRRGHGERSRSELLFSSRRYANRGTPPRLPGAPPPPLPITSQRSPPLPHSSTSVQSSVFAM